MIIVAGKIYTLPGTRDQFLELSRPSMEAARSADGCDDFVVAADPLEENRVNVYEAWQSQSLLDAFRGSGPDADIGSLISRAAVKEYVVEPGV